MKRIASAKNSQFKLTYEPSLNGRMTVFLTLYGNSQASWSTKSELRGLLKSISHAKHLVTMALAIKYGTIR